jgi:hypothetical protein
MQTRLSSRSMVPENIASGRPARRGAAADDLQLDLTMAATVRSASRARHSQGRAGEPQGAAMRRSGHYRELGKRPLRRGGNSGERPPPIWGFYCRRKAQFRDSAPCELRRVRAIDLMSNQRGGDRLYIGRFSWVRRTESMIRFWRF